MDKFFLIGDRHLFGRYTLPEKNTDRVTLSETHSIQGKLEELTLQINDASISILVQVLVFLVAIYWLLPIFSKKLKLIRNRSLTIQHFCQIPCKNCRFLAKNQYLKCAIHPSKVLTAQAANCSDYWCKNESD